MRLIIEIRGRAWILSLQSGRVAEPEDDEQEFDRAPVDPHSAGHCQVEQGPGADAYTHDVTARRFGFHGG